MRMDTSLLLRRWRRGLFVVCVILSDSAQGCADESHLRIVGEDANVHGICAGLSSDASPGALYSEANKITPSQCSEVEIPSYIDGRPLNWTAFARQVSGWLTMPLDAWPWEDVGEAAFHYTHCGCECNPEGDCHELAAGCPIGFWIASLLHCATLWASGGAGPGAEAAERRCQSMDPFGQLFEATSIFFPFLRLIDILLSGWPLFAILLKVGALAPGVHAAPQQAVLSEDGEPDRMLWRERRLITEALAAAAALVHAGAQGGRVGARAFVRLRYRVADAEARLCSLTESAGAVMAIGGRAAAGAQLRSMAAAAAEPLALLYSLQKALDAHFLVAEANERNFTVCPALPDLSHQGSIIEEASFVTEFHELIMEEVNVSALAPRHAEHDRMRNAHDETQPSRRHVWATYLIANSEVAIHMEALRTLVYSIRRVELVRRPFLVLTLGELSASARSELEQDGLELLSIDVEGLRLPDSHPRSKWWEDRGVVQTLARLSVFNLTQFDRVVVVEGDMIMLQPCDELFRIPVFATGYELGGGPEGNPGLNTGIMVVSPDAELFAAMLEFARVTNWQSHYMARQFNTDQSFLDIFWNSTSRRLGAVRLDVGKGFLGCGSIKPFRGGPSTIPMQDLQEELEMPGDDPREIHCLLPLEYNYYADFKHLFLIGYRHSFTEGGQSIHGFPTPMDTRVFECRLRAPILDRAARWLVRTGQLTTTPRILHWPGSLRKPWQRWASPAQSVLDEVWWALHREMCALTASPCRFHCELPGSEHTAYPAPEVDSGQASLECFANHSEAEACCCDPPRGLGGGLCWDGASEPWQECCAAALQYLRSPHAGGDCLRTRWSLDRGRTLVGISASA